ncbi:hypothetical protein T03_9104 [Trichinella britovi]|uniref:Uncharacterized protein n=1 Tax=Trichinella britovi TaxID=45882 RepID=A0A0V1CHD6_TRIBR|nr:hypothetical protein T03_9104 [Trichinella britovi]
MQQLTLGSRVPTGTTWQLVNYLFSAKVNIARACVGNSQFLELETSAENQYDQYEEHEYEQYVRKEHVQCVCDSSSVSLIHCEDNCA